MHGTACVTNIVGLIQLVMINTRDVLLRFLLEEKLSAQQTDEVLQSHSHLSSEK